MSDVSLTAKVAHLRAGDVVKATWRAPKGKGPHWAIGPLRLEADWDGWLRILGYAVCRKGQPAGSLVDVEVVETYVADWERQLLDDQWDEAHWLVPKVPDDPEMRPWTLPDNSPEELRRAAAVFLARADALEAEPGDVTAEELAHWLHSHSYQQERVAKELLAAFHVTRREVSP